MLKKAIQARKPVVSDAPADAGFNELHPVIQRILANRNIQASTDIDHGLKHLLPPDGLRDIEQAAARVVLAIEKQQHILIVGDYDADGATSTALAISGLQSMGAQRLTYKVPNRFTDGYGLSHKLAQEILQCPPDLLITVDNGVSSIDGVALLMEKGVDVIVTDHHLAGDCLPAAYAIVNPNQPGCAFQSKSLSGVGVMFYLLLACNRQLRESGYYQRQGLQPDILQLLDLVALGTVADLVPLDRNNRILVAQGVARMRADQCRPGIAALMRVAGRAPHSIVAQDLGFVVGPRLNAAGRLEDISSGIECLLATDSESANALAKELDGINKARKTIELSMQSQAIRAVENLKLDGKYENGIVLFDDAWHEGVVGLVASRVKDKTGVPVLVFAPGENKLLKGSARSIPEVHIRDVLANINAAQPDLIERFGGHAMAAGLSIEPDKLVEFRSIFEHEVKMALQTRPPTNTLLTDGTLSQADFTQQFAELVKTIIPWGQTCPEPQFEGEFEVLNSRFVGDIHLKMVLRPKQGGKAIDAICFRYLDYADSLDKRAALEMQTVRAVYSLDINYFRGEKNLQLIVQYLEAA